MSLQPGDEPLTLNEALALLLFKDLSAVRKNGWVVLDELESIFAELASKYEELSGEPNTQKQKTKLRQDLKHAEDDWDHAQQLLDLLHWEIQELQQGRASLLYVVPGTLPTTGYTGVRISKRSLVAWSTAGLLRAHKLPPVPQGSQLAAQANIVSLVTGKPSSEEAIHLTNAIAALLREVLDQELPSWKEDMSSNIGKAKHRYLKPSGLNARAIAIDIDKALPDIKQGEQEREKTLRSHVSLAIKVLTTEPFTYLKRGEVKLGYRTLYGLTQMIWNLKVCKEEAFKNVKTLNQQHFPSFIDHLSYDYLLSKRDFVECLKTAWLTPW